MALLTVSAPGQSVLSGSRWDIAKTLLESGTYLIWGQVNYDMIGATVTELRAGLSVKSATLPTQSGDNVIGPEALSINPIAQSLLTGTVTQQCGPTLLALPSSGWLYLVAQPTFSLGTVSVYGTIFAILSGANFNYIPGS